MARSVEVLVVTTAFPSDGAGECCWVVSGRSEGKFPVAALWSDAANSAIERRLGRCCLTGRSDRSLFTGNRLRRHFFPDTLPQAKNFSCGKPFGSELRNPKSSAERILMIVSLYNIRQRQNSGRVQRCGGFAEAIAFGSAPD